MSVHYRAAVPDDSQSLTDILNAVILAGGTTAHQTLFDAERTRRHYITGSSVIRCTVALRGETPMGFQVLLWPNEDGQAFDPGWGIIATFVGPDAQGLGMGRGLFDETVLAAKGADVTTIDATIRADNTGGLKYYSAMGFSDYDVLRGVPLRDGTIVDRVRKRYDL